MDSIFGLCPEILERKYKSPEKVLLKNIQVILAEKRKRHIR